MGAVRPLRRSSFIFAIGFVLTFAHLFALRAQELLSAAPPRFHLESPARELGYRSNRVPISYTFELANVGGEPLTVNVINRSCTCMGGELSTTLLPPGEKGELTVTLEPKGEKRGETYKVALATNDPALPEVVVELHVQWAPPLFALPAQIRVDPKRSLREINIDVISLTEKLNGGDAKPAATITKVSVTPDSFSLRKLKSKTEGDAQRTTFALMLPDELLDRAGSIRIETDSPEFPKLEIPIVIGGPLFNFSPATVSFGVVKAGASAEKKIEVLAKESAPLAAIQSADDRIDVTLEPAGADRWIIHTKLSPTAGAGRIKTTIELLDGDGAKLGEIPVIASVLK